MTDWSEDVDGHVAGLRGLGLTVRNALRLTWRADRASVVLVAGLSVFGAIAAAGLVLMGREVLGRLIDGIDGASAIPGHLLPILVLLALFGASTVATAVANQRKRLLSEQVKRVARDELLDVALAVDLLSFEEPRFFDRFERAESGALTQPFNLVQGLLNTIGGLAGMISLVAVLISFDPLLIPTVLLTAVPLWVVSRLSSRLEFRFFVQETPLLRRREYLYDVLTDKPAAQEVRAFGFGPALRGRYSEVYHGHITRLRRHVNRRTMYAVGGACAVLVVTGAAFSVLLWLVAADRLSVAEAGAAAIAVKLLGDRMSAIFKGVGALLESATFLQDLESFVATKAAFVSPAHGVEAPADFEKITVSDLCFSYPASTVRALTDVDLHICKGEVVALVGANGSGKTTLAKLLSGLFNPDSGLIAWDGVDTRSFDPTALRRQVAVVFQDFGRYQLTAQHNIGLGKPEAMDDVEGVRAAADQVGINFLSELRDGINTMLSTEFEGGTELSIGQWQRIALARAVYRDAPLVVLDEPTSALDPKSERELFDQLPVLLRGRTAVIISHRFSTVRSANRIYVLSEGQIVEHGTHDELMAREGLYADMFTTQASAYTN